ncbi:MAG: glycosyltransferase family 2 protein [Bacteroidetes bacterium]|nr:glycosyltransferase family 2 protein [Bacteroidota bacterium]
MKLSPIVLFVYNRPNHVKRTLESLTENVLANESELIVYSDGPKNSNNTEEVTAIKAVRDLVQSKSWCKSVKLICDNENKGLRASIVDGVTETLRQYDRVIVLEDDLVLSRNFLTYMNESLQMYEDKKKVMHISGYSMTMDKRGLPDTYFLSLTCTWGWATWSDRWKLYMHDPQKLYNALVERNELQAFSFYGDYKDLQYQLEANLDGRVDTWAIKWYASTFLNKGLTLYPKFSLVRNIGLDSTGESLKNHVNFDVYFDENAFVYVNKIKVEESRLAYTYLSDFLRNVQRQQTPTFLQRVLHRLQKMVS